MKVNIDADFFNDTMKMGVRMVIRDDERAFVTCRTLTRTGVFSVDDGKGSVGLI